MPIPTIKVRTIITINKQRYFALALIFSVPWATGGPGGWCLGRKDAHLVALHEGSPGRLHGAYGVSNMSKFIEVFAWKNDDFWLNVFNDDVDICGHMWTNILCTKDDHFFGGKLEIYLTMEFLAFPYMRANMSTNSPTDGWCLHSILPCNAMYIIAGSISLSLCLFVETPFLTATFLSQLTTFNRSVDLLTLPMAAGFSLMTSQDDLPKAGILMGQDGEKPIVWGSHLLVVWNMNFMTFHSVGNVIIPTDELIFFRGVGWNHQPAWLKLIWDCMGLTFGINLILIW